YETFHGRDIFAYAAGRLGAGIAGFESLGPAYPVEEIKTFPLTVPEIKRGYARGHITLADHHFGSVTTNISIPAFEKTGLVHGDKPLLTITHKGRELFRDPVLYHRSFGFAALGEPILYNGSTGYMLIGLNQANFTEKFGLDGGLDYIVILSL
ncbi:MAG: SAM-dependent chlorinase/fluorinase, partial [Spirochaetales bacterium]|nr:SAM-dependent chlorinase/fluorinase [Spirochaetales bacterium]